MHGAVYYHPAVKDTKSYWPMVSTMFEVFFYEPLNTTKQPTPMLQVYSNAGLPSWEQDYTQPTPSLDARDVDSPLVDQEGYPTVQGFGEGYTMPMVIPPGYAVIAGVVTKVNLSTNHEVFPQPDVRMLKVATSQDGYATSVRFSVHFARSLQYRNKIGILPPSLPTHLKIVCGFLENSYHRSV
jgi:hypothetical protein